MIQLKDCDNYFHNKAFEEWKLYCLWNGDSYKAEANRSTVIRDVHPIEKLFKVKLNYVF